MNSTTMTMQNTDVTTAPGMPLNAAWYRDGATVLASGLPLTAARYRAGVTVLPSLGAVCLQVAQLSQVSFLAAGEGGFAGIEAGRPAAVRINSDFSKPRYGSQASDGTG